MSAFDRAWDLLKGDLIRKTLVDMVMDAQPYNYGTPEYEQRDREIDEALEKLAQANGITTADLYRWADIGGHPDDPASAVSEDVDRKRQEWERANPGVEPGWGGWGVPKHGVAPDPELQRLSDEWDATIDHPGGEEHLDSIEPSLGSQINQAMEEFWRRDGWHE